ncbi:MAG: hypothetical protein LBG59_02690 [Candidatus Peribacteria bacterium]|jgi:hypothetical protein|nr:hypothetical protein [Candidatus Peribacteria bacterium]
MKLEHQINPETNNSLQGTTKCTEIHVDNLNHLYNGRYMDLIIKILKKNVPSLLQDILNTKTILLENLQYTEDLIFKREISK